MLRESRKKFGALFTIGVIFWITGSIFGEHLNNFFSSMGQFFTLGSLIAILFTEIRKNSQDFKEREDQWELEQADEMLKMLDNRAGNLTFKILVWVNLGIIYFLLLLGELAIKISSIHFILILLFSTISFMVLKQAIKLWLKNKYR